MFFLDRHVTVIKNDVYLFFLKSPSVEVYTLGSLSLSLFNDLQLKTHTSKSLTVEFKSSNWLLSSVGEGKQCSKGKTKS